MKHAIRTIDLTKVYGQKTAVNAVNLTVEEGELFALLGINGAGKTTTIKMLTCLSRPTSGDALVLGDSIVSAPQSVKDKINVSPQETAIARSLSVRENVEFIAQIYGSSPQVSRKKADEMLLQFGLTEVASDKAKTLSGGMQRRLSIAMALISSPGYSSLMSRRSAWMSLRAEICGPPFRGSKDGLRSYSQHTTWTKLKPSPTGSESCRRVS